MIKLTRAAARLYRKKARAMRLPRREKRRLKAYAVGGALFGLWAAMPGAPAPMPAPKSVAVVVPFEPPAPLPASFWYQPQAHIGETIDALDNGQGYPDAKPKRRIR